jgi:replicative superfamily II helicase
MFFTDSNVRVFVMDDVHYIKQYKGNTLHIVTNYGGVRDL